MSEREAKNFKEHQCYLFFQGRCKRGADCRYGHLVGADGKPQAVAPELLEYFEKRNAAKANKPKASMITSDSSFLSVRYRSELHGAPELEILQGRTNQVYIAWRDSGHWASWKIEATNSGSSAPVVMVATDLKGKQRQLNRVDNLHYLSHSDFMSCLIDAYRKVDVLGQVTEQALKKYIGSLRSKKAGQLGSVAELQESSSAGPSADEGLAAIEEQ
eukprot:6479593-Amphidinium_carterae.1